MKKLLFTTALLIMTFSAFAQYFASQRWDETREEWYRRMINFDYDVPDYSVNSLDPDIVGWRTAEILQRLMRNGDQALINRKLSQIRNLQMGEPIYKYSVIDKMNIKHIQKQDSVITITINTFTKEKKKKIDFDLVFTFVNSLSDDEMTNTLFSDIGRYIREDDNE